MLVWTAFRTALFGFLRMSGDFHLPTLQLRLSRASLTATLSVCHAALLQHLRDRNFRHRSPAPPSARRPLALSSLQPFPRLRASPYSSPGSFAVTLVEIVRAVVSFQLRFQSFTVYLRIFRSPSRYSSGSAKCQAPGPLPLELLESSSLSACQFGVGSIATIQASIPQSGSRLRFGATPLVPCPFAFQPNPDSVRSVAEQTLKRISHFRYIKIPTWLRGLGE